MADLSRKEIEYIKKEAISRVANNIKQVRIDLGITQTELANRVQSDRQYIYKIENGLVGLSVAKLAILAKALEIPLEKLAEIHL